jgi:glucose-6-phosphate dehydrogenase assembly protein OpcA
VEVTDQRSSESECPSNSVVRNLHGTSLDQILAELASVNAEHLHSDHPHSASRSLNLVVAASKLDTPTVINQRLDALDVHHPSRTVVLVGHAVDRLDARLDIDCNVGPEGGPGFCHDRIVLMCDSQRLAHADSIVAKLRVVGLPTVVWIGSDLPDRVEAPLVSVSDYLVIDSQRTNATHALHHARGLARKRQVHDLAWGRLASWRRHIAAAFEPESALGLLQRLESVEVTYSAGAEDLVALLWGWIAKRLGLRLEGLTLGATELAARAPTQDHAVRFYGAMATKTQSLGVIQKVAFRAGTEQVEICLTHPQGSDVVADALHPVESFMLGYDGALSQAADALSLQ